jgi:peptidyl-prolyl cis-trans isomerase B (cyclophilin B)
MSKRPLAVLVLLALPFLASCGDDSDTAKDTSSSPEASSGGSTSPDAPAPSRTPTDVRCSYPADGSSPAKPADPPPDPATVSGQLPGTMKTSVGTFNLTLDADRTPCTVNSFVSLADQGYFDGTTCHRMTTSGIFVLQCGDPTATGSGTPGYSFDDELDGSETYPAGTLAMANGGPNTNGSQFFIVYDESPLPPDYVVFGTVDDVTVAAIEKVAAAGTDTVGDGKPLTPVDITSLSVE